MNMFAKSLQTTVDSQVRAGRGGTRKIRLSAGLAAAVALSLQLGFAPDAGAKDLTCHKDITVIDNKPTAVKVLRFMYKTDSAQKDFYYEGLANKKLSHGESHTWKNQKLGDVASGNPITEVGVEYRDDTSGQKNPSDPWGPVRTKTIPAHDDCNTGGAPYKVTIE
jgi:hypothetical protein